MNEKTILKVLLGTLVMLVLSVGSLFVVALQSSSTGVVVGEQTLPTGPAASSVQTFEAVQVAGVPQTVSVAIPQEDEEDDEEEDVPITGNALDRASAAALAYIGEGRVTDSEIGDEEGYYEIEISLPDGGEVDVHLDENFKVLSTEFDYDDE